MQNYSCAITIGIVTFIAFTVVCSRLSGRLNVRVLFDRSKLETIAVNLSDRFEILS